LKKLLIGILMLLIVVNPIYGASGFAITFGETTYTNSAWKSSMMDYFQSHTDKNVNDATMKVITASEVNSISKDITGRIYPSNKIFSCAMVDLGYVGGIRIIVDKSKIKIVTPKMYANALKSTGIENGYVVVSSPVQASGEAALAGVLKSYEIAVGAPIPESAKKAATEELYVETQVVNQTGQTPDRIATLFEQVKNEVQNQNLQNPDQIKITVINIASSMKINITDKQAQQIADSIANSQRVQPNLTEFKQQLQNVTENTQQAEGILNQIFAYIQWFFDYIKGLITG